MVRRRHELQSTRPDVFRGNRAETGVLGTMTAFEAVILSTARSRRTPMIIVPRMALRGTLTPAVSMEFPATSLPISNDKGSFDYVGVRLANANFAQDDTM